MPDDVLTAGVPQAAGAFIYRRLSNNSADYPEGIMNKDVLKTWLSVSGPQNNVRLCHFSLRHCLFNVA